MSPPTPTALRLALLRGGFDPLPARGKKVHLTGWATARGLPPSAIKGWARGEFAGYHNTGVLCGDVVAVDIDVMNRALAEKVMKLARRMLGANQFLRIGMAPKAMLIYRIDKPIKKLVVLKDARTKIEILSEGQQFVAFGIHPDTKKPYTWPEKSLLKVHKSSLPQTSEEDLHAFLKEAAKVIGAPAPGPKAKRTAGHRPGGKRTPAEIADAEAALRSIPNDDDDIDYDSWIKLGMSFHVATDGKSLDVWEEWSARSSKNEPEATTKKWDSFDGVRDITAATLFAEAKRHGHGAKTKGGKIEPNAFNAACGLRSLPDLAGLFAYNEMTGTIHIERPLPGERPKISGTYPRQFDDNDAVRVLAFLQEHHHPRYSITTVYQSTTLVSLEASYHPVLDYLAKLKWDGKPRLDTWLLGAFGIKPAKLWKAVGRAWLIAMVRRVRDPGCKFDTVPVLQGKERIGKSLALRILAGGAEFFTDDIPTDLSKKDASDAMRGKWLIEMAELTSVNGSDHDALKAFISRQEDLFRPVYGRKRTPFPRQSILCGTTNRDDFLVDSTGNRRFWVLPVVKADTDWIEANRDQLFAEACAAETAEENIYLDDESYEAMRREQGQYQPEDGWEGSILDWLAGGAGYRSDEEAGETSDPRDEVRIEEIMEDALGIIPRDRKAFDAKRIGAILRRNGWKRMRPRSGGAGRGVVWIRIR